MSTNTDTEIRVIQFKRGIKAILESRLVSNDLGVPESGEPIFETDTGQLKIGDGITPYKDLSYITGPKFIIKDPLDNQILVYDEAQQAWINKNLTDDESIIYLDAETKGLSIKGYSEAKQGQMLVKDKTSGLAWIDPISDRQLQDVVSSATQLKDQAGIYAQEAGNYVSEASTAADRAEASFGSIVGFIEDKFWWGTAEEYNAIEHIKADTFYFIKSAK